mgnify:CR=1 FL=1
MKYSQPFINHHGIESFFFIIIKSFFDLSSLKGFSSFLKENLTCFDKSKKLGVPI